MNYLNLYFFHFIYFFSPQKSTALTSDTSHQGKIQRSLKLKLREVSSNQHCALCTITSSICGEGDEMRKDHRYSGQLSTN